MKNPSVRIKTNYGSMEAELFPQEAPNTVANFLSYVKSGFYENTLFHRVMVNFVIQGGGLNPGLYQKKSDKPIQNEATNGLKNEKFTLSMARLPDPHSATSQFFINMTDNGFLDYAGEDNFGYCVFGRLNEGANIALAISEAPTEDRAGFQNVPTHDIVIETVELLSVEKGQEP